MSFVARELERIQTALNEPERSDKYAEFYAVQQALSWALDPSGFATPYALLTGNAGGSTDYSAPSHHSQS